MNATIINALIGMGMPVVISFLNQAYWSPRLKGLAALAACLLAATVTEWVRGEVDWADWTSTFVVVFGAAVTSYRVWWQPSGIAPTIEAVTTVGGPDVEAADPVYAP